MLEQIAEKMKVLKSVVASVEKQFGKGAIMALGNEEGLEPVATIGSGSLALDLAMGVGGYPRGRVVEVYGPESSGKTTLALHAIAQAQRSGGVCAFIDAEHAIDINYARAVGVEIDKLLVSQPDTGEQALDIAEMLVRSGAVDLIVVDSVAALTPRAELEGEMGDSHMGLQARLMSQALRKLTGIAYRTGTTLMFINQLRQKIGVTFGNPETTTGGNALKFYASMRLDVRRIGQVKIGDELVGGRTRVKLAKNKCEPTTCLRVGAREILPREPRRLRLGAGLDADARREQVHDLPPLLAGRELPDLGHRPYRRERLTTHASVGEDARRFRGALLRVELQALGVEPGQRCGELHAARVPVRERFEVPLSFASELGALFGAVDLRDRLRLIALCELFP
jgi:recombination protein RecA